MYQGYKPGVAVHFGCMTGSDEFIHPVPWDAGYEWTETNMFGFNIPEADIDCLIYLWFHPVLKVTYGGVVIWQGSKRLQLEAESLDIRAYMPMPSNNTDWTTPNGLTIKMISPMEEFQISYQHTLQQDTSFDLNLRAIMPPAVRGTNNHLTQAMKTSGHLILRGKRYKIDGYHTRDRSWGEHRSEKPHDLPPLSWIVGVVDESFSFHVLAADNRDRHPEWTNLYSQFDNENNVLWGYVWSDGKLLGIEQVRMFVARGNDGLTPKTIELDLLAENGLHYEIIGTCRATIPLIGWPNMLFYTGLTEWRYLGRTGWGDIQDINYSDHAIRFDLSA